MGAMKSFLEFGPRKQVEARLLADIAHGVSLRKDNDKKRARRERWARMRELR